MNREPVKPDPADSKPPARSLLWEIWCAFDYVFASVFIFLVRIYQKTLSPFIGMHCRFHPTCSEYCIGAIRKYGAFPGIWYGFLRILRCNPYFPGGIDPP
jgi:hypothetical protein